jgi:hypothetical protein
MKQQIHTIERVPWGHASTGVRVACEGISMMLWPLKDDDRLTALLSLLVNHIDGIAEDEGEEAIDAILDAVRLQLKMRYRWQHPSPPIQNY